MSEQHKQQFRGIWLPAEILRLAYSHKLNWRDISVLAIVDSLVSADRGCYASNNYLAEHAQLKRRQLQAILAKLKRMGLIIQGKNNRDLETVYSRVRGVQRNAPPGAAECTPGVQRNAPYNKTNKKEEGIPMPFFDEVQTSKHPPSQFDVQVGKKLHEIVTEKTGIRQRYSMKVWADEIRKLRNELQGDEKRILKALTFYSKNAGRKGVPRISGGKSFRKCFSWLEDAMQKQPLDQKEIEITEEAKKVARRVQAHCVWPKGSKAQVPAAVQVSLSNVENFRRQLSRCLKRIRRDNERDSRLASAERVLIMLSNPPHFVEQWFVRTSAGVANWQEWSGDLAPFIVDPAGKAFQKHCRGIVASFCGDGKRWESVMEEMSSGS